MKIKLIFFFFLLTAVPLCAQTVQLNYAQQPLNEILLDLNERYQVQVSIDAGLSANCVISIQQDFSSLQEALNALAKECGLSIKKINNVYVFRKEEKQNTAKPIIAQAPPRYLYQGQIVEANSQEPLPFSYLQWGNTAIAADEEGRFSFTSGKKQEKVRISHLGYQWIDTLVGHDYQLGIALQAEIMALQEIDIEEGTSSEVLINASEEAGHIKLNNVSATLLPGSSANLIFSNLRLYPGITAAGESIDDYVIWGSFSGQNHVTYDGITLFNSWGINNDIGRVNPLMVKNIEVYKGGYNVPYGDRVGGIVMIDSKFGNREKPSAILSLTNEIANGYVSLPLFGNGSSLQIAGRKSYAGILLKPKISEARRGEFLIPEYDYEDLNAKLSTFISPQDQLEISFIASRDNYESILTKKTPLRDYSRSFQASSTQAGASLKYARSWKKGGLSTFTLSHSDYRPKFSTNVDFKDLAAPNNRLLESYNWQNNLNEYKAQLQHTFTANQNHHLQLSLGWTQNQASIQTDNSNRILQEHENQLNRLTAFIHDYVSISKNLSLELGLKADLPTSNQIIYWQPRINAVFDFNQQWSMSAGWGIYNQFIGKSTIIDEQGNRSAVWQTLDGIRLPALQAKHYTLSTAYASKNIEWSMEAYYKNTSGMSYFFTQRGQPRQKAIAKARTWGLDMYIKKPIAKHEFWLAYSLGQVEEMADGFGGYTPALQNQLHELKTSLVLNFSPIYIATSHVYGSGFPLNPFDLGKQQESIYSRFDIAIQYQAQFQGLNIETGLSVLNVFNHKNIRLNQSSSFPDGAVFNTLATPFTPSVYLNLRF